MYVKKCPECGSTIAVAQTEIRIKEPKCSCGRKEGFTIVSKEFTDVQRIVLEETQEIADQDYPRQLSVFLRGKLTDPSMGDQTRPGSKVRITGLVEAIPIPHSQGGLSRRFDLVINADTLEQI